jgi:hypothetical protein
MSYDIEVSKKSAKMLIEKDVGEFCPDVNGFQNLLDLQGLQIQNLAARVIRERIYVAMADLIKTEKWRTITTIRFYCYECRTLVDYRENPDISLEDYSCPFCKSKDTSTEVVPAFMDVGDFYKWCSGNLQVSKRTISLRKEFLDRCERLGVPRKSSFAGIATWGINWTRLVRKVEQAVNRGDMPIEEAQNLLENYDAFADASSIVSYTNTITKKDSIEKIGIPNSPDFVVSIVDGDGQIKMSTLYLSVPLTLNNLVIDNNDFWRTDVGQMVARNMGIQTEITYGSRMDLIPDYDFTAIWESRQKLLAPIRKIASALMTRTKLLAKRNDLKSVESSQEEGILSNIRTLVTWITQFTNTNLETSGQVIEQVLADIEEIHS